MLVREVKQNQELHKILVVYGIGTEYQAMYTHHNKKKIQPF